MPKLKTHRGAAKRFKKTASGKFLRAAAFKRHILTSKTTKRKRQGRGTVVVVAADQKKLSACSRTHKPKARRCLRVKRGTVRRAKRKKLLARAKGFYQTKSKLYRAAKEAVDTALKYAFVGRRLQQARLPPPVGHAHQCRGPRERPVLQPVDQGTRRLPA